jgi:hypothetical protein
VCHGHDGSAGIEQGLSNPFIAEANDEARLRIAAPFLCDAVTLVAGDGVVDHITRPRT